MYQGATPPYTVTHFLLMCEGLFFAVMLWFTEIRSFP